MKTMQILLKMKREAVENKFRLLLSGEFHKKEQIWKVILNFH